MTDNAIIRTSEKTLSVFSTRDELKEMGDRLRKMMPSAQQFSDGEALAVAQVALAHGLDPFTGEVWGLKSQDGKWYGVMVGIKGLRKSALREAIAEDTTYWTEFQRIDPGEAAAANTSVVYKCIIRDTKSMQAYGKTINILTTAGVPYKEAIAMIGPAPQVVGIGIANTDERSKLDIHRRAKKRAESDAIKQRFALNFSGANVADEVGFDELNGDADVTEGEFTEAQEAPKEEAPLKPRRAEQEVMAELGFN